MLRNNTMNFREKYRYCSLQKELQSTGHLTYQFTGNNSNSKHSEKMMPVIGRSMSAKKLSDISLKQNSRIEKKLTSYQKLSEIKLKKSSTGKRTQKMLKIQRSSEAKHSIVSEFQPKEFQNSISVKAERNSLQFIETLPKNSVFFCGHCFQYVFEIQKVRHYPNCKDVIAMKDRKGEHFIEVAHKRIANIVELARYTKTKIQEIEVLYSYYEKRQLQKIEIVQYPSDYQFFTLQEITHAFCYTVRHLLQGVDWHQGSTFFNCF